MNAAHLHLLINHFPVIGTIVLVLLLAVVIWRWNAGTARLLLISVALMGVFSIGVYLTGEPAEEVVEDLPGVAESLIEEHEEAALVSTILLVIAGAVAAGGVVVAQRKKTEVSRGSVILTFVVTLIAAGAMGWTSNLGGQIRHSEIRADAALESGGTVEMPDDD